MGFNERLEYYFVLISKKDDCAVKQNRPLSAHLTIYQPQVTSMFSIFHRVTGAMLAIFVLSQPFFIRSITFHLHVFTFYNSILTLLLDYSWILLGILIVFVLFFHYHLANGIRHIVWDINANTQLNLVTVIRSSRYIVMLAFILAFVNVLRIYLS